MNQPASLQDRLDRAKRELNTAVDNVRHFMLETIEVTDRGMLGAKRFLDVQDTAVSKAAHDLYYFHANAANSKAFEKRLVAVFKAFPSLKDEPVFNANIIVARQAYGLVGGLSISRKAEVAAKRAGVKAKAALKADLNLQEGVKLQDVDVGQYQVILAGLEPVRLHVLEVTKKNLLAARQEQTKLLEFAGWDGEAVSEWKTEAGPRGYTKYPEFFLHFFDRSGGTGTASVDGQRLYAPRAEKEVTRFISNKAQQQALAYVQGYAVKLALKTGEVIANDLMLVGFRPIKAEVSSSNLWSDSVAKITLREGLNDFPVRFHTQMIWNQSVYGLQFNQFPTRRID